MEILGDDEAGLPTPPPRRWPIGQDDEGRAPLVGAPLDVTASGVHVPDDRLDALVVDGQPGANGTRPDGEPDALPGAATDVEAARAAAPRWRLMLDAVTGPEALGPAGIVTALAGATTTGFSPFVIVIRPELFTNGNPVTTSYVDLFGPMVAAFAAVAAGLGLAGLFRLKPSSPAWSRGLCGAAVILGVLMLLADGYAIWNAPTVPTGLE